MPPDFFEGNSVADMTPQTCGRYIEKRAVTCGVTSSPARLAGRSKPLLDVSDPFAINVQNVTHLGRRCGNSRGARQPWGQIDSHWASNWARN
jgi:hypothetical protein